MTGIQVPREAWQPDLVPDHLKITFRVIDGRKQKLAESKDLVDAQTEARAQAPPDPLQGLRRAGEVRPDHLEHGGAAQDVRAAAG